MRGLEQGCAEAIEQEQLAPAEKYDAFFAVLKRDAESAIGGDGVGAGAAGIGSQLIDNLNASIHLRALLADLFLVTEILDARQTGADALSRTEAMVCASEQARHMYSSQVLDHFEHPRNAGTIADADASARIENPACGDFWN